MFLRMYVSISMLIVFSTPVISSAAPKSFDSALVEASAALISGRAMSCPDGVPEECICAELSVTVPLPTRYSQVQSCPHPVLDGVKTIRTYTAEGAIIDDMMMKDGNMHGAAISWHPNGQVEGISNFHEGRQIGFARVWHDNGALFAEQQFDNGQSHGLEVRYDRSGEVEKVIVWEHGQVNRERMSRISKALGLNSP